MSTLITPHFMLEDMLFSDTAIRNKIDNSLPVALQGNLKETCLLLERIRFNLSKMAGKEIPIHVTSGFRCPALNAAIGSSKGSDHLLANAADFKAPAFGTAFNVAAILAPMVDILGIGQLIYEFDSWVHVSTIKPTKAINRVLTMGHAGTVAGIIK